MVQPRLLLLFNIISRSGPTFASQSLKTIRSCRTRGTATIASTTETSSTISPITSFEPIRSLNDTVQSISESVQSDAGYTKPNASSETADFPVTPQDLSWAAAESTNEAALPFAARPPSAVLTLLHSFPSLEPTSFAAIPTSLLALPFRRDILWQAVVYENDTLHDRRSLFAPNRAELGYSKKKMAPQKGRGMARVGKAGSPIFNHGGKPFGPRHPDDRTLLNRRVYNLALRTAFSYAYQRGNLVVLDGPAELVTYKSKAAQAIWEVHAWSNLAVLVIVAGERKNLNLSLRKSEPNTQVVYMKDLDVRTLLKAKKIIVEREALAYIEEYTQGKKYLDEETMGKNFDVVAKRVKEATARAKKAKRAQAKK
ncbi:ribosomal protein L4 domain-containing protein [Lipomyces orientalis]|uniref:Ribosomal protein L4 domain-containing protein n=1 Tax=Lipomyces orientalis TaxID=1233043 RepID=A0ACC3TF58_9ASCO